MEGVTVSLKHHLSTIHVSISPTMPFVVFDKQYEHFDHKRTSIMKNIIFYYLLRVHLILFIKSIFAKKQFLFYPIVLDA
jgi:hypothetical protein